MVCQTDCHRFGVAPSKFQTRLRVRGNQAGWSGDHPLPSNVHFFPYMEYLGGVIHTYSLNIKI